MSNTMSNPKPIIVSLEGNIGAGKSTLLAALEATLCADPIKGQTWVFLKEPVHLWTKICDKDGNTMLSKFYADPAKYSFAFQIMAFTTRLHELRRIIREHPGITGIICERSLDADQEIFAKMLHDGGQMEDVEFEIYQQYFQEYDADFTVDAIIYCDTDAATCYDRVKSRSRDGESGISLEYLEKCREYHELWLRPGTGRLERPGTGRLRPSGRLERPLGLEERPLGRLRPGTEHHPILTLDTSLDASFDPIDQRGEIWLNQMIDFLYEITVEPL
jgi:deoxyadenosine/deoxycytidine kinase